MYRSSPCFRKSFQTDALFFRERSGNLPRSCKYFIVLEKDDISHDSAVLPLCILFPCSSKVTGFVQSNDSTF
jgi:hypothetical protein